MVARQKAGVVLAALLIGAGVFSLVSPAAAEDVGSTSVTLNEGVCVGVHIDGGNQTSIVITAPAGQAISQICVKAGSINQGDGPEYTTFDPPVTSVTLTHSTGKEISHYVVTYVTVTTTTPTTGGDDPDPTTTTTVVEEPTTTTTVGGEEPTTTTEEEPEIIPPVDEQAPPSTARTLPRTGQDMTIPGIVGAMLIAAGAFVLRLSRKLA